MFIRLFLLATRDAHLFKQFFLLDVVPRSDAGQWLTLGTYSIGKINKKNPIGGNLHPNSINCIVYKYIRYAFG